MSDDERALEHAYKVQCPCVGRDSSEPYGYLCLDHYRMTRAEWEATIDYEAAEYRLAKRFGLSSDERSDLSADVRAIIDAAVKEDEGDASANSAAIRHKLAVEED